MKNYDVIIVGGGPAGLSAALVLGRCRHTVLVCDSGRYRNHVAHALHGFLSRDGLPPTELRRIGREQLQPYGVSILETEITHAVKLRDVFRINDNARRDFERAQVAACNRHCRQSSAGGGV